MKWFNYSDREKKVIWWVMLIIMIGFLSNALYDLSQEGAIEYCVKDNESIVCFKERYQAEAYVNASSYPKNLDYSFINNYSNISLWDK